MRVVVPSGTSAGSDPGSSASPGLRGLRYRVRASDQRGGPGSLHNNSSSNVELKGSSHLRELCSDC